MLDRCDRSGKAHQGKRLERRLSQTGERYESNLITVDPLTGEIKKSVHLRYPNYSGTLAIGRRLTFLALLDGTVATFDDTTLEEVWKINVGSGFSQPPIPSR